MKKLLKSQEKDIFVCSLAKPNPFWSFRALFSSIFVKMTNCASKLICLRRWFFYRCSKSKKFVFRQLEFRSTTPNCIDWFLPFLLNCFDVSMKNFIFIFKLNLFEFPVKSFWIGFRQIMGKFSWKQIKLDSMILYFGWKKYTWVANSFFSTYLLVTCPIQSISFPLLFHFYWIIHFGLSKLF